MQEKLSERRSDLLHVLLTLLRMRCVRSGLPALKGGCNVYHVPTVKCNVVRTEKNQKLLIFFENNGLIVIIQRRKILLMLGQIAI